MSKIHRSVVRNQAYSRDKVVNHERHNERKNENYHNGDVDLSRSHMNVHFKRCDEPYLQQFDKLVEDGIISTRGLKPTAKIIDEMIFDVNTEYFESHGGYDYAKSFFEEAYRLAVKEVGDEKYILSAVMHADELNKEVSERLGYPVYHYHLHVVYVPVVDKEIKWSKRCKDKSLVGTVKEQIKQVSHSKKWGEFEYDDCGQRIYSYSLLQDRYFEHMQSAGFTGFERGKRGSTTKHLSVAEYKTKQEQERLSALEQQTEIETQKLVKLGEIDDMVQKTTFGKKLVISPEDWEKVSGLAKERVKYRQSAKKLKSEVKTLQDENKSLTTENVRIKTKLRDYTEGGISDKIAFGLAMQRAPERMKQFLAEIKRNPPEQQIQQPVTKRKEHENGLF
jgi:regulator of replication initiation timing